MSKHGSIRRYALIIEKAGQPGFPSFRQIKDYLFDHGFEVSDRTIQRDIEQIRFEFGIEVAYNRHQNGYHIDLDNSINIPSFLRFLEIVNTAELLTDCLKDSRENLNYLMFESHGELRGLKHLKPLLFAIKNRRRVSFLYEKYASDGLQKRHVEPYLLKEYQNRWYLVGISAVAEDFRIFGIDRIRQLEVSDQTFAADPGLKPHELFRHTIGLTYTAHPVQDVVLEFTRLQGKYVQSLPMHPSQQITDHSPDGLKVKLRISPNFEFRQKILMLGSQVRVLEPLWLAGEIREELRTSLGRYD